MMSSWAAYVKAHWQRQANVPKSMLADCLWLALAKVMSPAGDPFVGILSREDVAGSFAQVRRVFFASHLHQTCAAILSRKWLAVHRWPFASRRRCRDGYCVIVTRVFAPWPLKVDVSGRRLLLTMLSADQKTG